VFATESWLRQYGEEGGERNADSAVVDELTKGVGAYIMGRKMFGGGGGEWDKSWTGWWGEDPPFGLNLVGHPPAGSTEIPRSPSGSIVPAM
jgi:hypothetical protein